VQSLSVRLFNIEVVQRVEERPAHEELHREVVHSLWVLLTEVRLRVVPDLNQAVTQGVGGREVGFEIIKAVPRSGEGVLDVVDDALLDREDIVLGVRVCRRSG
jgi:hypothetical protein